jgi:hypothetical protein
MYQNVAATSNVQGTITGIHDQSFAVNQIAFDPETYLFAYGDSQQNITDEIYSKDKQLLVPDFDLATENYRRASANGDYKPGGIQPLETSTAKILVEQLTTDPLAAPLASLNNTFDKLVAAPGVRKFALLGFLGLAIYFVLREADK